MTIAAISPEERVELPELLELDGGGVYGVATEKIAEKSV
jgi:hypothetical protein